MAQDFRYKKNYCIGQNIPRSFLRSWWRANHDYKPFFFFILGERHWVWKIQPAELTPFCTYPTYRYSVWYFFLIFFDFQTRFRKGRGTRHQIANIHWIIEKATVPEKYLLLYWLCQSLSLCGSQKHCGKFWKRWEYQTPWPASWEICMQVRKQQFKIDMEQQTGYKLG